MKKKIAFLTAVILAVSATGLVGCGNKENDKPTAEEIKQQEMMEMLKTSQQNDYMGGIERTKALKKYVLSTVEKMKSNNGIIREENPNSYWEREGYQDFVSSFLTCGLIEMTEDFNEEKASWDDTLQHLATSENAFTKAGDGSYTLKDGVSIRRNEKDDYVVTGFPFTKDFVVETNGVSESFSKGSTGILKILYDCDKDWCQSYMEANFMDNTSYVTKQTSVPFLFEYMRLDDNNFIIQTETERLYIVLQPIEKDTVIFDREIKEFYYSRLTKAGFRTTFTPYEYLPEISEEGDVIEENKEKNKEMKKMPYLNEKGDIFNLYGKKESVFLNSPEKNNDKWTLNKKPVTDWIFEDKSLQQAICFKDGVLVATTYNKLSESYERFSYEVAEADTKIKPELEKMVQIKNLVGDKNPNIKKAKESEDTKVEDKGEEEKPTEEAESTTLAPETEETTTEPAEEDTSESEENTDEAVISEPVSEENTEAESETTEGEEA